MASSSIESESKYSLTKSFAKNFTWKIDGFAYGPASHAKQFKFNDASEMKIELRSVRNRKQFHYVPYILMRGSKASHASYNLSISDQQGRRLASVTNGKQAEYEYTAADVFSSPSGYSWLSSNTGPFPTVAQAGEPESLMLQLEIESSLSLDASFLGPKVEENLGRVSKDIAALAESDELSDFVFTIDGQDFPVHKTILGARSIVFKKMFAGEFKERSAKGGVIEDISKEAFQKFLSFIYSGKVELTADDVMEVLDLSNKYEVDDLKTECEMHLLKGLNVDNALDIFQYSHFYNCSMNLKKAAFRLVQKPFAATNRKLPDKHLNDPEAVKKSVALMKMLDESMM